MASKKVNIIITGGTIDSYYDGAKDTVVPLKSSILPEYFELLRMSGKVMFTELFMKDSRKIDSNDLKRLIREIESSKCSKIIITHGTYTMPDTSRYLSANLASGKTIILTGSLIPIRGFTPSDGPFNLGFSYAMAQKLPPGVYICMHGNVYKPEEVAKDMKRGMFYSIFGEKQK